MIDWFVGLSDLEGVRIYRNILQILVKIMKKKPTPSTLHHQNARHSLLHPSC